MQLLKNIITVFKKEFHTRSYFKQVLYSYILISCITFLIFSVLILTFVQNQHNKEMQEMNKQNIEQAYTFNSSILQGIFNYSYSMLDNATVRKVLYGENYDTVTALEARDIYDDFLKMNSIILSLDFINYTTNTVLTKSGRVSLEQYADQELLELISTFTPGSTPVLCYPREAQYSSGTGYEPKKVLSMIYYISKRGAMVVNLDYDTYCSLLNFGDENSDFQMVLLNHNNLVMASSDKEQFATDYSQNPIYQKIQEQSDTEGTLIYQDNTGKYSVSYNKVPNLGITYLSMYSLQNPYEGSTLFWLIVRYSIVYLVVTLLLSVISSYFIYNPIKKLKATVSDTSKDIDYVEHTHINDFEFLESIYKNLVDNNLTLNKANQNYKKENMEGLLKKLIDNTANQTSITSEQLESIDTYFQYLNYLVFLVEPEMHSDSIDTENDISTIKFVIMNVTTELMEPYGQIKVLETSSNKMIFICNFESYDKKLIQDIILKVQDFFDNIGLFRLSFGFGEPVSELENLSHSFDTAKAALFHSVLSGNERLCFFEDILFIPPSQQHYPYDADKEIITSLKAQSKEGCQTGVELFFQQISGYQYDQFYRCVLQLDAALQRYEYSNELAITPLEDISSLLVSPNLQQLQESFQKRCDNDISALLEIRMHSFAKNELIQDVKDYIEEYIYDPNLSVSMIAEKVNLSVNYLRNIYKENTGESLTTYIAQRKLTLICEMLADKDMPIQDISDKLGFTTKNYFFTFFKKHMNMTPNQYRTSLESK